MMAGCFMFPCHVVFMRLPVSRQRYRHPHRDRREKKEKEPEPEPDPERDQRTVFAYQVRKSLVRYDAGLAGAAGIGHPSVEY